MSAENNPFRRTALKLRNCPEPMERNQQSLWLGSCFTENLGPWLGGLGYPVLSNPFGVVFHPLVMEKLLFASENEIHSYNFLREDVWLNFLLGSPFFAASEIELNKQITEARDLCQSQLKQSDWLVLTFGTAFLYHHSELGPVGKCHKMPASLFEKRISSVEEISSCWKSAITELRKNQPGLRVLLSLSPVRHSRDGLEENALSKATLRLSIEDLRQSLPSVYYFPAWEIMNDELRDYRFFASDLVHPSEEAIHYLRQQFEQAFLRKEDEKLRRLAEEIQQMEKHRPSVEWSAEARRWQENLAEKKAALREQGLK
jgi:hypothetical protein